MINEQLIISFIIPSYNEENNITNTITSIKTHTPNSLPYEIILVDHDSSDNTVNLARNCGAITTVQPSKTIGGLRNVGVNLASGKILIFLDADIRLTHQWSNKIENVVSRLRKGERILTGSCYCVPESPTWIEKFWFKSKQNIKHSYINSGHLIISKILFKEINGFSEELETGEDYDISMRAVQNDILIEDDKNLIVIHEGFPKNLHEFIKREYWHGKGDTDSISSFMHSKVALVSILFLLIHLVIFFLIVFKVNPLVIFALVTLLLVLPGIASINKYKNQQLMTIFMNTFLYYVYFLARASSIINLFSDRNIKKRQR